MKPPAKPVPMQSAPAAGTAPRRPSFPASLASTVSPLSKSVAPAAAKPNLLGNSLTNSTMKAAIKAPARHPASLPLTTGVGMDSQAVRTRMVQKLAAQGISDPHVLAALGHVERHRFVDTALANQAYEDTSLPIGLGQTISKPNVVARMLELLRQGRAEPLGRVLEIGTGCGYQAAVLAQLAKEVYSIERLRGLHDKARENLRAFRLANLHLLLGDGMLGFAQGAPYAGIIAAAGGQAIPQAWTDQLAVGGRLVAPMEMPGGAQALVVVDKTRQGLTQTVLEPVHFVPLKSGVV